MEGKLGLYDILGRLVPGALLLWACHWMNYPSGTDTLTSQSDPFHTIAVVAIAYLAGLLCAEAGRSVIQPIAWKLNHPTVCFLNGNPDMLERIGDADLKKKLGKWETAARAANDVFFRYLAKCEDSSAKVQAMQAQYGLHRNVAGAGIILFVLSLVAALTIGAEYRFVFIWLGVTTVFTFASWKWAERFARSVFYIGLEKADKKV